MASSQVIRVTMFKLVSSEQVAVTIASYKELAKTQAKNGKPYILSLESGPSHEDARNQGYSYVSKTVFKNREDHDFYDKDCPAHQRFKQSLASRGINVLEQGIMTVFYTPVVTSYIQEGETVAAPASEE